MAKDISKSLVVAVSSRALFDLENFHTVYKEQGYSAFHRAHMDFDGKVLEPGPAFEMVQGLLNINEHTPPGEQNLVEVVVVSSQHPDTGLNILHSIRDWKLPICRAIFTGGAPTLPYIKAFGTQLLLSKSEEDVQAAVDQGIAAARLYDTPENWEPRTDQLRIAFDGDSVLFSHESEAIYRQGGLEAFEENETRLAKKPMIEGPFGLLLKKLHRIQKHAPSKLRMALITARGISTQERASRTLREWGVELDESFFLNGLEKSAFVQAFGAHLFIDDQEVHLLPAAKFIPCARVPYPSSANF